jgi:hypothetical protein
MLERLRDPQTRQRLKNRDLSRANKWENIYLGSGGPGGVLIGSVVNRELDRCRANASRRSRGTERRIRSMQSSI